MNSIKSQWWVGLFICSALALGACKRESASFSSAAKGESAPAASAPAEMRDNQPAAPTMLAPEPGSGERGVSAYSTGGGSVSGKGSQVAEAETPIDPNGRFATTYRPGAGHLSAFESAVARGIIPPAEREVVSDLGARYVSGLAAPRDKALVLRPDLERAAIQPGGGPLHLRLTLRSTDKNPTGRPHLSVHLVLDVSGSMQGEPIERSRAAARQLVDKLDASDDFSLVTFSSEAQVRVPDGPVGARRALIFKAINDIKEGGGTNIGAGLQLGYQQASSHAVPSEAMRVVFLLSDGRANSGITDPSKLSKLALDAFQNGVQTSTFGLGTDYDGALMSAIASDGAGGYYYLRDSEQIAPALNSELEKRLDPVATAVEVRVRLKDDIQLLRVYGSRRLNQEESSRVRAQEVAADKQAEKRDKIKADRQDDTEGGMRFFIPAFSRDDSHAMLLKLQVPKGVGKRQVAVIELKYKDRVSKQNVADEQRITLDFANSDADSAKTVDPSVARTIQGFAAGETLMEAASLVSHGNRNAALALLSEREQILRQAAQTLSEPGFERDADRLARLRGHMSTSSGLGEPLVLSMMLETAGRTHMH